MASWIIHAPYTAQDGRDYRPGDTVTAEDAPDCDATRVDDQSEKPRRGRPLKAQTEEESNDA